MTKKFTSFLVGLGVLALAGSASNLIHKTATRPEIKEVSIMEISDKGNSRRVALINYDNGKSGVFYEIIPLGGKFLSASELNRNLSRNDFNNIASNLVYSLNRSNSYVQLPTVKDIVLMGFEDDGVDVKSLDHSIGALNYFSGNSDFFFQNPTNVNQYVSSKDAGKIDKSKRYTSMERELQNSTFSGY